MIEDRGLWPADHGANDGKTWLRIDVTDPALTLFQKILLVTDGTVTELLSLYCEQPIIARKILQSLPATAVLAAAAAGIAPPLMLRAVILENADGKPLLHATSCFALDSMPAAIRRDLQETDTPIGLLWRRERLEMYRELLGCQKGVDDEIAAALQVPGTTPLLQRSYRLFHHREAMGLITETFATSVLK